MAKEFEVYWEGELLAAPEQVWQAFTAHAEGYLWKIAYEPWVGGVERGLTPGGGTVTAWDPPKHFTTLANGDGDAFNQLDYRLQPSGAGTHLSYLHRGMIAEEDFDRELDACQQHTAFYNHSLGEYARHFSGRDATYIAAEAAEVSAHGGFAALRRALGLSENVAAGDRVRLTPTGLEPIEGVVDYSTPAFLGVRSADALYRFYGRDAWGWPVAVAHHVFAGGVDKSGSEKAWDGWLARVLSTTGAAS